MLVNCEGSKQQSFSMVVTKQKFRFASEHDLLAGFHRVRNKAEWTQCLKIGMASNPAGKKTNDRA
jgi:hypothetical protein